MKPNIFSIAFNYHRLGDEDMVTALWHYVLTAVPGVGQAFVDDLADRSSLPRATFIGTLDHPQGNRANRPDLLVQCDAWSLLFEHKIDSPVGPLQLERYLDLVRSRKWKLAVMAKRPLEIASAVADAPEYVAPSGPQRPRHFLWQDLQPLLRATNSTLAAEFADFMEERGLGAFTWAGLGNPFFNPAAADTLRVLYGAIRPVFLGNGVQFVTKANSLVFEVRRPFPSVHLINVGPLESVAQQVPTMRGPVMALWVWMPRDVRRASSRVLPRRTGPLIADPEVVGYDHEDASQMSGAAHIFCERSYYVPLGRVLVSSPEQCNQAMRRFAQVCVDHLQEDIRRIAPLS